MPDTKKKRNRAANPPPQKMLYLGYTSTSTGGEAESNEQWASHSPRYIKVKFTSLSRESGTFFGHNIVVTDEVYAADEVYLIVVRYQDGDTFGTSHGNWTVWAATASEEDALKIAGSIEDGSLVKEAEKAAKKTPGHYAYFPWTGYFAHLEGVEVHAFKVAAKPADDTVSSRVSIHRH